MPVSADVAWLSLLPLLAQAPFPVRVDVDLDARQGRLKPIYSWFGYGEPNCTYLKGGRKLLSELAALILVPVHVRAHNLLTSGDGAPALKWGSTNAYAEDASGQPIHDWTIIDRIFGTCVERGMKPLVEIGFMPIGRAIALRFAREGAAVDAMTGETLREFGGLGVLVNNAGAGLTKLLLNTTLEEW